jgi:FK506-binding protein 2
MHSFPLLSFLSFCLFVAVSVAAEGLQIEKTHAVESCKRRTADGDVIEMHYRGTLASDGSQFDSSYDRDSTLVFELGAGRVIKGYVDIFPWQLQVPFNDVHMLM